MITLPASAATGNETVPFAPPGGKYCARSAARREYIAPASNRWSALEFVTTTQLAVGSMAMPVGKKKRAGSGRAGSGPNGGGSSAGGPGKLQAESRLAQRAATRMEGKAADARRAAPSGQARSTCSLPKSASGEKSSY